MRRSTSARCCGASASPVICPALCQGSAPPPPPVGALLRPLSTVCSLRSTASNWVVVVSVWLHADCSIAVTRVVTPSIRVPSLSEAWSILNPSEAFSAVTIAWLRGDNSITVGAAGNGSRNSFFFCYYLGVGALTVVVYILSSCVDGRCGTSVCSAILSFSCQGCRRSSSCLGWSFSC